MQAFNSEEAEEPYREGSEIDEGRAGLREEYSASGWRCASSDRMIRHRIARGLHFWYEAVSTKISFEFILFVRNLSHADTDK
jgi:hypothetical protein